MSDKFNGFSQEEISKVSGVKNKTLAEASKKEAFRSQHVGIRRMPEKWNKPNTENLKKQQVNRPNTATKSNSVTNIPKQNIINNNNDDVREDTVDNINLDRSMSKSLEEALFYQPIKSTASSKANIANTYNNEALAANATSSSEEYSILKLSSMPMNINGDVSSTTCATDTINDSSILPTEPQDSLNAVTPSELNLDSPFKGISLKDFEMHRKMIQEQNKQKKELLCKAIEHHSKKTAAEARKIEEIKFELAKLDNDLAIDVAILRKQIDNACIHFSNIEKQYVKIEAQFLKAKLDLHNAAEKKELLTEHLCTVIAHNEDRKAQKLSELMQKVGITPTGEYDVDSTTSTSSA